jgi:hypothetical protein
MCDTVARLGQRLYPAVCAEYPIDRGEMHLHGANRKSETSRNRFRSATL